MNIEDQIAALLAKAEPLRLLDDVEAEAQGLGRIVDAINALRAKQPRELAVPPSVVSETVWDVVEGRVPVLTATEIAEKRKPGRPKKAD